jgi:hypothetical protein
MDWTIPCSVPGRDKIIVFYTTSRLILGPAMPSIWFVLPVLTVKVKHSGRKTDRLVHRLTVRCMQKSCAVHFKLTSQIIFKNCTIEDSSIVEENRITLIQLIKRHPLTL